MSNRLVLVAAAGATALLAAGAGLAVAGTSEPVPAAAVVRSAQPVSPSFTSPTSSSSTSSPTTEAAPMTDATPAAAASEITRDAAASIALAHVGGGRVSEIESEYEHGRHEWKVEIVNGQRRHDVRVDSTTGAITRTDVSDDRGRDRRGRDDNPGADDRSGHDDRGGDDRGSDD